MSILSSEDRAMLEQLLQADAAYPDHVEGTCFHCDASRLRAKLVGQLLEKGSSLVEGVPAGLSWAPLWAQALADLRNRVYPAEGTPIEGRS